MPDMLTQRRVILRPQDTSGGGSAALLLDTYTGAAAAYSLRKLCADYSGSAIRVRRSSDDAEQNIGFDGNDLDESALTTFVGAGDGFVATWYDQSGSGKDATQSTSGSQPRVVASGTVVKQNNFPAIDFLLSERYLDTGLVPPSTVSIFTLFHADNDSVNQVVIGGRDSSNERSYVGHSSGNVITMAAANTTYDTDEAFGANHRLVSAIHNGTTVTVNVDGVSEVSAAQEQTVDNTTHPYYIGILQSGGSAVANTGHRGNIQEVVVYSSDKSDDVSGIETAINSYYSIF